MFSQESSQAIFEMGNVELIELKNSRIQFPSCLHHALKGTTNYLSMCQIYQTQPGDFSQSVRKAFDVIKTTYFRASHLTSKGHKHLHQLWKKHHHKAKDALRGTRKDNRTCTSVWERWQNDATYRKS